jgi:quercetin dioxygenase-like cupin family protein
MSTATATDTFWFIQNLAVVKVWGTETGDAWSMVELTGPRGDMPPLHLHRTADEAFYVLDGELTVFVGDEETRLSPGECAVAPQGIPHVYRVDSEEARWLAISSPAAGFERFVAEAGVPAEAAALPPGPPAIAPERLAELADRYDIEILGPPGTLP